MAEVAAMWEGGITERPDEWLRANGWDVTMRDRASLARSYNRALANETGGFITATRR
jgi:hypothetical protein